MNVAKHIKNAPKSLEDSNLMSHGNFKIPNEIDPKELPEKVQDWVKDIIEQNNRIQL
jgi:hypothetical protein